MMTGETNPTGGEAGRPGTGGHHTLVIGVGNEYAHDDAAGLLVARRLGEELPDGVGVVERSGEASDLMQTWVGSMRVILVDATRSGAPAGTRRRWEVGVDPLPTSLFATSTHTLGVAQAIEMARALGRLPSRVTVYGIEGADFSPGRGLSPPVARAVAQVARQIRCDLSP